MRRARESMTLPFALALARLGLFVSFIWGVALASSYAVDHRSFMALFTLAGALAGAGLLGLTFWLKPAPNRAQFDERHSDVD